MSEQTHRRRRPRKPKRRFFYRVWDYFVRRRQLTSENGQQVENYFLLMSRRHRIFYLFYVVPMLLILTITAVLMYIPWLIKCCRPSRFEVEGKKVTEKYDANVKQRPRDVWLPYGYGEERYGGFWRGWQWRSWEIYCLLREYWHTLHRQGLQVLGVICGVTIGFYQIQLMAHDIMSTPYEQYLDAVTSGGSTDVFKKDAKCAYTVGTGIPNWGDPFENLAWYCAYHGTLLLLCLMLIGEELFNVRLGLFAPQWSRAGTGYTIMFLAVCTLTGSPNWGWTAMIRLRYLILVAIFLVGFYNVICTAIASGQCSKYEDFNAEMFRNARYPLQPWKESDWAKRRSTPSFMVFSEENRRQLSQLYWTERWQCKIGDHAWPLNKVAQKNYDKIDDLPKKLLRDDEDEEEEKVVMEKSALQKKREQGHVSRKWLHGFPIMPPPLRSDQKFMRNRYYHAELYDLDKFKIDLATREMVEPTDNEVHKNKPGAGYRWESKREFQDRKDKDTKKGAGFFGIADWEPHVYQDQRGLHIWFYIFDIRRAFTVLMAAAMILVHAQLMAYNMGAGYSSWPTYRAQYDDAAESWKKNNGPSSDECQYYQGSSLAVWIKLGDGSLQGVFATLAWYTIWELFIIGMCLAIILVGLSNNRTWGMHLPFGITLIGPRLSSISMGWTIGFIGVATMQLGFFDFSEAQMWIARLTGYGCLGTWASYIVLRNEPMRNLYVRRPFIRGLSSCMMYYMDDKKYRRRLADFDDL